MLWGRILVIIYYIFGENKKIGIYLGFYLSIYYLILICIENWKKKYKIMKLKIWY